MSRPLCKRCLLRELDGEYFKSIYQYIDSLPEEQKASPDEYARRLEVCQACGDLQNGMCAQCGCFAEVRAAKKRLVCPMGRWGSPESRQQEA